MIVVIVAIGERPRDQVVVEVEFLDRRKVPELRRDRTGDLVFGEREFLDRRKLPELRRDCPRNSNRNSESKQNT